MSWKPIPLIVVAVAVMVMGIVGMGLLLPDDLIPEPIPNSTAANQSEMIEDIAVIEMTAFGWLGWALIIMAAVGIFILYYGRLT